MTDPYVTLEAGADIAGLIQWLIGLADPTARARCTTTTFHPLLADLHYAEDTDWMAAADNLAESIGMKVHRLAGDVWVLAPRLPDVHVHVELDGQRINAIVAAQIEDPIEKLTRSIARQARG